MYPVTLPFWRVDKRKEEEMWMLRLTFDALRVAPTSTRWFYLCRYVLYVIIVIYMAFCFAQEHDFYF